MSRCILDDEEVGTEVVIGWDPTTPIRPGSFFARVVDASGREVFRTTGVDKIYDRPDELIAMIQPYAEKHDKDRLLRELILDQAQNSQRSYSVREDGNIDEF